MIERLDPNSIAAPEGQEDGIARFIESDFRIRSGLCPNGHGLMQEVEYGQECPHCRFSTNKRAEREVLQ